MSFTLKEIEQAVYNPELESSQHIINSLLDSIVQNYIEQSVTVEHALRVSKLIMSCLRANNSLLIVDAPSVLITH